MRGETQAKEIVGGKIERKAKVQEDEELLATHRPQVVFLPSGVHPLMPQHAEPVLLRGEMNSSAELNLMTFSSTETAI